MEDKSFFPFYKIPKRPRGRLIEVPTISLEDKNIKSTADFLKLIDSQEVALVFMKQGKWESEKFGDFTCSRQAMQVSKKLQQLVIVKSGLY